MFRFKVSSANSRKGFYCRAVLFFSIFFCAVLGFVFHSEKAEARDFLNSYSWYISPSDPYLQNWSDTVSIGRNNNWDSFIAITGFRGDGLTKKIGIDARTITASGDSTPVDVIANQSNPNTLVSGGVAEFDGIGNPTIALKGDSTANAPFIQLRLNTKNCSDSKFLTVAYNVRDLDGSVNDAVQQVNLQYRIGETGDFTNVPGGYIADATEPDSATKVTPVYAYLPPRVLSEDVLFLRIMTTNAVGNDEWIGIDDIIVGCSASTAAEASVSGKVMDSKERGVKGAIVVVTDRDGNNIVTRTNSFGFYKVEGIFIGEIYIIHPYSKASTYNPKILVVSADRDDLDFMPNTSQDMMPEQKSPPE